MRWFC